MAAPGIDIRVILYVAIQTSIGQELFLKVASSATPILVDRSDEVLQKEFLFLEG